MVLRTGRMEQFVLELMKTVPHIKKQLHDMITLPSTTRNVGEQLSREHATQKVKNRDALLQIMSCVQFLCRQGLAMRGDGDKSDSNLHQLLKVKPEDDTNLNNWLKKKGECLYQP